MKATNVQYELIQHLLENRTYYNETFIKIAQKKGLRKPNWHTADWIIQDTIMKSIKKATHSKDSKLYEKALSVREQYTQEAEMTEPMRKALAKAILEYQIRQAFII